MNIASFLQLFQIKKRQKKTKFLLPYARTNVYEKNN